MLQELIFSSVYGWGGKGFSFFWFSFLRWNPVMTSQIQIKTTRVEMINILLGFLLDAVFFNASISISTGHFGIKYERSFTYSKLYHFFWHAILIFSISSMRCFHSISFFFWNSKISQEPIWTIFPPSSQPLVVYFHHFSVHMICSDETYVRSAITKLCHNTKIPTNIIVNFFMFLILILNEVYALK